MWTVDAIDEDDDNDFTVLNVVTDLPFGGGVSAYLVTGTTVSLSCDFNGDSSCNTADLSSVDGLFSVGDLTVGVAVPPADGTFDLDGNNVVDGSDLDQWLVEAAAENGFGSAYLDGDANLDGDVAFDDFIALSNAFGTGVEWSEGNFNGDGTVGFDDFIALSNNFGQSATAAVPEPGAGLLLVIGLLLASSKGRQD